MHKQVLYFSVWPKRRKNFEEKAEKKEKECDFQIVKDGSFSCASDLLLYLENHHDILRRLYVIIDYLPFFSEKYNYEKEAEAIGRAVLGFPEVYFLFDDTYLKAKKSKFDFSLFLFSKSLSLSQTKLEKKYHCFDDNTSNAFVALTNQRSNLFDGSNLRFCLKCYLYDSILNVERHNFCRVQSSRSEHLAVCVEEERSQNRFNSFALYANGFRVWPIMSARELKAFNEMHAEDLELIVRDYDLQFSDADEEKYPELKIDGKEDDENLIDYIRGAKYLDDKKRWISLCPKNVEDGKEVPENFFWNKMMDVPRLFVSKGVDHLEFITGERKFLQKRKGVEPELSQNNLFVNNVADQQLSGMYKPVTGIYCSFQNFKLIKDRYEADVCWDLEEKSIKDRKLKNVFKLLINPKLFRKFKLLKIIHDKRIKESRYYLKTSRKEHHHGVPLDIYDLTNEMIDRARKYHRNGEFVFSAMVAHEVMEILNGFHESLMLKAYHIYVVSENAICMNLLGGDEDWLRGDAYFRVNKTQQELKRMLAKPNENQDRKGLHSNILNQIFSDCRQFCKKKEHFKSEIVFIGAMGHLNEGYTFRDIIDEIKLIKRKILKEWDTFCEIFQKWKRERKK
jgi:hypothetical protein